jgi:PAS domain S-box-containing protein
VVGIDITKQYQAENKYRNIFENAVEGIFQMSKMGNYLSVNPAFVNIFGYTCAEILMQEISSIKHNSYVKHLEGENIFNILQDKQYLKGFETEIYRQDGKKVWISLNVNAIYNDHGNLQYYEGIIEDISLRKKAEETIKQVNQELEVRVKHRTVELQKINQDLTIEQNKSEQLLLNMLPFSIAQRLKQKEISIADRFEDVTILFADLVDFTKIAAQVSPSKLVTILNDIFSTFDHLTQTYNLEKIKTIGDSYMVVGGLPNCRENHAEAIANLALEMQKKINLFRDQNGESLKLRIGINTGAAVAGVIGLKKFSYDLWGDAVNVASRMESYGEKGKIQVSESTYNILKHKFMFEKRGLIDVKGKGKMLTYWLLNSY